ncbi:glycosyltransferase family 4 protein [Nocardioides endophyticus]|uniref:Glycosyltransferase family 4 protein n=1 Tax=Nocardioides endophyticus TaxID=1353775 RepID=A0ABP8Z990_9ACTN
MRLGVLSQWFAPEPGGGAVPTVLANGLVDRGHDVQVVTGFPNYPTGRIYPGYRQGLHVRETLRPSLDVRRVPLYASHDQRAARRSLNYLSFAGSAAAIGARDLSDRDAMWVFNSPATVPLVARRVRRRYGVPYLLHIMDVWPDSVIESGMVDQGRAAARVGDALSALVRRGYDAASRIALTSPGQRDLLVSRGVPADLLEYCPVWADEAIFSPRPADRSVLPEAARDARVVLMYAGALGHVQGLDAAVRAASEVRDTGLHFVVVGSGIADEGLRALARDLGATNVHFMGRRAPEEMGDLSSAADVHLVSLVDTPLMRVTMPSKLPSVLALARPVVLNGAGDAARVITESGAGIVAPSPDALADVLRQVAACDRSELQSWGAVGLDYYRREFSLSRGVAHVESMLADIAR